MFGETGYVLCQELNQASESEIAFIESYGRIWVVQGRDGELFVIRDLLNHRSIDLRLTAFTDLFYRLTIYQGEKRK